MLRCIAIAGILLEFIKCKSLLRIHHWHNLYGDGDGDDDDDDDDDDNENDDNDDCAYSMYNILRTALNYSIAGSGECLKVTVLTALSLSWFGHPSSV